MAFDPSIIANSQKLVLTLDSSVITTNQTDFPLTIKLDGTDPLHSALFSDLGTNSFKLSIESGITQLPVEIEIWNETGETAVLHTKVPVYSSSADTDLVLSYDSAQDDNTDYVGGIGDAVAQTVWDSDFTAVYHNSVALGVGGINYDSTSNANNGTAITALSAIEGDNLNGLVFGPNANNNIQLPASSTVLASIANATIEVMAEQTSINAQTLIGNRLVSIDTAVTSGPAIALGVSSGGYLGFIGYNGSFSGDLVSVLFGSGEHCVAWSKSGSTNDLYYDGVAHTSSFTFTANEPGSPKGWIGKDYTGSANDRTWNGGIFEIRISKITRSAEWIKLTYLSLTDQIISWSAPVVSTIVTMALDQSVILLSDVVQLLLNQPAALLHAISMSLDQSCSSKLQLMINQWCKDMPSVSLALDQLVRAKPSVKLTLNQLVGTCQAVKIALNQPITLPALLQLLLNQPVTIPGQQVALLINQPVQLSDNNGRITLTLNQPTSAVDNSAVVSSIAVAVTVAGRSVDPDYISLRVDDQDAFITATIRFPDYAQYALCAYGDEVIITETITGVSTETTYLQVQSLTNPEEPGAADHVITAISETILLDEEPLTEDFGPGIVDVLLVALCFRYGFYLDWQGVTNWPVLTSELAAADETAMEVLRRVATASGAYLQSLPDGTLRLLPDYPVSVSTWPAAVTFDLQLTDQDHIFNIDEQADPRDGYNAYLIAGQSSTSDKYRLEEETISATVKEIRCYMTPWDGKTPIALDHTGGDWVSIDALDSVIAPLFEYIKNEQVEIVAGQGNTAYPIAIADQIKVNYRQDSLGGISAEYDGSLTTAELGDALIEISYWTKYIRWRVTDPRAESLQLYIKEVA